MLGQPVALPEPLAVFQGELEIVQLIIRLVRVGEGQEVRPQIHAHILALDADLHGGAAHHIRSHGGRLRTRSAAACSGTLMCVSPESSSASSSSTLQASTSPI